MEKNIAANVGKKLTKHHQGTGRRNSITSDPKPDMNHSPGQSSNKRVGIFYWLNTTMKWSDSSRAEDVLN